MAKPNKTKQAKSDQVPNLNTPSIEQGEQEWYPSGQCSYVVTRNGIRVSDKEYLDTNNETIQNELSFWKRVVSNYPDGSKVEIVQFDKKKHRIW